MTASWLIFVDDDVWGYTKSTETAEWAVSEISANLSESLKVENPNHIVNIIKVDDNVTKVKLTSTGYIYNTQWTVHTVRRAPTPIFEIKKDETSVVQSRKRSPSVSNVLNIENITDPSKRPPTPTPSSIPPPPPLPKTIPTPPPLPKDRTCPETPASSPQFTFMDHHPQPRPVRPPRTHRRLRSATLNFYKNTHKIDRTPVNQPPTRKNPFRAVRKTKSV